MTGPTRRDLLTASGAAIVSSPALARGMDAADDAIDVDLRRYIGFGDKASGGPGDTATSDWLSGELAAAGYRVERSAISVPYFTATVATLTSGITVAQIIPQAIVIPTPGGGASGPLVRVDPLTGAAASLKGAIALLDLPHARWSSALAKAVRDPVTAALSAGAAGVVVITNGPTGEAIALNAPGDVPLFKGPVATIAPKDSVPFLVAALRGAPATLRIEGEGGMRPAANLIGRIDRGKPQWIVVSTPQSGWFACAGERGPGVAAWLALARWAALNVTRYNLAFLSNSGHEYEYLGSERAFRSAPAPERTRLWLHLGANVAARDWQDAGKQFLALPSADPQRFLLASEPLLPAIRAAFAGQPGLEAAYPATAGAAAGELTNIIAAGYGNVAGIFGAHRFHHSRLDDQRNVSAALVERVIRSWQTVIAEL